MGSSWGRLVFPQVPGIWQWLLLSLTAVCVHLFTQESFLSNRQSLEAAAGDDPTAKFLTFLTKGFQGPMEKHVLNQRPPSLPQGLRASWSVHHQKETILASSQSETHMLPEDGGRHCLTFPSVSPCTELSSMGSWEGPCFLCSLSFSPSSPTPSPGSWLHPGSSPQDHEEHSSCTIQMGRAGSLLLPSLAQVIKLSGSSEQDMNKTRPSHQNWPLMYIITFNMSV